ncbi:Nicotianamine synthase [Vitis vinifera]|uniref:Nicotianamine synthase n=1 Tax=Vitis vinifera TaxID=29760 RepID=A0A438CQ34_VITVI|nr:Nicotianamine synthase [Vitis vinifera]
MASLQPSSLKTNVSTELLIARIVQIHANICKLESLRPSKQVNSLFTHLVKLCTPPSSIDITALPEEIQLIRQSLITLCGRAEGLLELEFSTFLTNVPQALNNLNLFPYYGNYVKLANLEYRILSDNGVVQPKKVAFIGSGPLPLTTLIMATHHMKSTCFDNFDMDESANAVARQLVASDAELQRREEKVKILGHVRKYMKEGGTLLVRSAKGARAFLYPVVEEEDLLGFEVLTIFHPTNEVINSVVLARKPID